MRREGRQIAQSFTATEAGALAKTAGVRQVIYAPSIHAVLVNPCDIYGASKCSGEALYRYMVEPEGVSAIALRIGAFQRLEAVQEEGVLSMRDAFVSHRDLDQLINCCIDVENVQFAVLHGLSGNRLKRLDISDARELASSAPMDDSTAELPALRGLHLCETLRRWADGRRLPVIGMRVKMRVTRRMT